MTHRKTTKPRSRALEPFALSRRRLLQGMSASVAAAACGSEAAVGEPVPGGEGGGGSGAASSSATGTGGGPADCSDNGGLSPEELLAPIDTIVVLMMENRSFDHMVGGSLGIVEGRSDIVGLSGNETNPVPGVGDPVGVFHMLNTTPESPPHQWDEVHAQWNNGKNDGFVTIHEGPHQHEAMGYYLREQVPVHHALADSYTICNAWHSSLLGGTFANRYYLHAATSGGVKNNEPYPGIDPIWGPAKDAGLTVKNYHHGACFATAGYLKLDSDLALFGKFKEDAAAGNLPNFSIIDPLFFGVGANDDHPFNADMSLAQLLISDVVDTLANSPQWERCLLLVIYDEHGGFYDHVAPPTTTDNRPEFRQLGFRVPAFAVGPYVRRGCAVNTVFDHVSILATLSRRFGIEPFNDRHASAPDVSSCIDPALVKNATPQAPAELPAVAVSMDNLQRHQLRPEEQHHEMVDILKDLGVYQRMLRNHHPDTVFKRHLDDCLRRGLAHLV